jgi:predicted membrane-bound spermidine synthase
LLFFVSGFCSLLYQVVWTRLAFASFGIITPVLSVVLSVFMVGIAVGTWAGGRWIGPLADRTGVSPVKFYAAAEFIIGLGAFAVPSLFAAGERILLGAGESNSWNYLSLSAVVLALSLLPWCILMGTTIPLMMAYIREREPQSTESFSYLYLANVLGAMTGTLLTAIVLVEVFGFRGTLSVAAVGNFTIAAVAALLGHSRTNTRRTASPGLEAFSGRGPSSAKRAGLIKTVLFSTGFIAMAMEVVWTRAFAPVVKTQVYSFAAVVATYLAATFAGSWLYRRDLAGRTIRSSGELLVLISAAALVPVVVNDGRWVFAEYGPHIYLTSVLALLVSICPFCGLLGYLTPKLVDEYAQGSPSQASSAYALNVLGCILGPLIASYVLLPFVSERYTLVALGLPLFGFAWACRKDMPAVRLRGFGSAAVLVLAIALVFSRSFEDRVLQSLPGAQVRRDYAASVLSFAKQDRKQLLVNGVGMTVLTPITKFMVHLPMAFHRQPPESILVICFGMGTSFRSALSWGIETTAVELVPGVKDAFGFYHADAAQCLAEPNGRIVIDDGRRFLKRTRARFDVIVIDPPPPPEAAGSSLLYSVEFYALVKQHLKPGGILQQWVPSTGEMSKAALRSLCDSFPYVRCFNSIEHWGVHLLASMEPIPENSAAELAARMPSAARKDLLEWSKGAELGSYLDRVLGAETPATNNLSPNPAIRISDTQPYNEYFLLRQWGLF